MRRSLAVAVLVAFAVGCAKKQPPAAAQGTPPPFEATTTPQVNTAPPPQTASGPTGNGNTNYVPGGGAVQNVRQAARRTVAMNDLKQLGVAIQQVQIQDGMPDKERIKAEVRTFGPIAAAINDGSIILTGTKDPAGLWAYEVDADTKGGLVLVGGTARRADAAEVKQLLGK